MIIEIFDTFKEMEDMHKYLLSKQKFMDASSQFEIWFYSSSDYSFFKTYITSVINNDGFVLLLEKDLEEFLKKWLSV